MTLYAFDTLAEHRSVVVYLPPPSLSPRTARVASSEAGSNGFSDSPSVHTRGDALRFRETFAIRVTRNVRNDGEGGEGRKLS